MPRLACPGCKCVIAAKEEERGQVMTCPSCGKRIRVPAAPPFPPRPALPSTVTDDQTEILPPQAVSRLPAAPPAAHDQLTEHEEEPPKKRQPLPAAQRDDEPDEDDDQGRPEPKKTSSKVAGVLGSVGALLLLAAFLLIVTGRWVDVIQRPLQNFLEAQGIHPILAIAVTAGIILVPLGLFVLSFTKSTILSAMPADLEFRPAKLSQFQDLDQEELDTLTATLEELGFRKLLDYTVKAEIDLPAKGFARLFAHAQEHCLAEINVAFRADGEAVPMRCNLTSFLEDGWTVSVGNRSPSKEGYLMRRPKAVWRSFPDDDPDQLLKNLLKLRKQMCRDLDVSVLEGDTEKAYFAKEKAAARERKNVVRRRWSLGILIEFWFFERNPKFEWLGDYRKKRSGN